MGRFALAGARCGGQGACTDQPLHQFDEPPLATPCARAGPCTQAGSSSCLQAVAHGRHPRA
eukprot:8686864-Alexandrium_andersonii.AAC.1